MKKIFYLLPVILLFTCSWVDPDTIDTYYGSITFIDSDYDVTRLSGRIQYYLTDYTNFGLDSSGGLLNGSPSTIKGYAIINGTEYPIQFLSNGGLQVQQSYLASTNIWRNVWVDYSLVPDVIPSSFSFSELSPIFILFLVFTILPLSFYRGILS